MPNPIETKKDVPAASTSATKPLSFAEAVARGRVSQEEALALFDSLPAVEVDFMLGAWKGAGFPTGHPLDGVLERYQDDQLVVFFGFFLVLGFFLPILPRPLQNSVKFKSILHY